LLSQELIIAINHILTLPISTSNNFCLIISLVLEHYLSARTATITRAADNAVETYGVDGFNIGTENATDVYP
jgi:hypothetical protein